MTAEELLSRLDGVRARGGGRWTARCPAHADRTPSLSVREGDKALLLTCFSGCSLAEITAAMGIEQRNLFYDTRIDPESRRRRDAEHRKREAQRKQDGFRMDQLREAERVIRSARHIDLSLWSEQQLDDAMRRIAEAHTVLSREEDYYARGF